MPTAPHTMAKLLAALETSDDCCIRAAAKVLIRKIFSQLYFTGDGLAMYSLLDAVDKLEESSADTVRAKGKSAR